MNKIEKTLKLQIPAGQATPASSIGPALGQQGVNIMSFCKDFNSKTQDQSGMVLTAVITVYPDKSYKFTIKQPPASALIKKILGLKLTKKPGSGSRTPGKEIIGSITYSQLMQIAEMKKSDLNSYDLDSAAKMLAGTAKSMGIDVEK